jgi:RNase H-fold protein (predicted Holliday junction resolvase)
VTGAAGNVLGIDPGSAKAGYAIVDARGTVLAAGIAPLDDLAERAAEAVRQHPVVAVALGRGTNAAAVAVRVRGLEVPMHLVDEFETTRRARDLYFAEHPPRGWRRLIPTGLQLPPRPIDDYAAILIARRFLARESGKKLQTETPPSDNR